ncbi:MAG: chromosomal replication initiator DnaA [Pseudomonadaceae bacterium]|nr:chromosomal replication initiator DnaA [Pseudomonadaceae bacterium]
MRQLLLQLPVNDNHSAQAFVPTKGSAAAQETLAGFAPTGEAHDGQTLLLLGPAASGKSHLLNIWQQTHAGNPLAIAVDDLQSLNAAAQEALFHTFNHLKEQGGALLVAGCVPLAGMTLLPDLKSRLATARQVDIAPPDDAELQALVGKWASDRQLHLPDAVVGYLLARAERSPAALQGLVAALDTLSLEQKRAVTVPLVKQILQG